MKLIILVLLMLMIMIPGASADTNVSVQIYENSNGVYFISVEDGGLQECDGDTCQIQVTNITTSRFSDDDIKDIARQVSLEIDMPGYNTTGLRDLFGTITAESRMADQSWQTKTFMPAVVGMQQCTLDLNNATNALSVLDAKFAGYDAEIQARQDSIDTLKKTVDLYFWFIVILGISTAVLIMYINNVFDVFIRSKRRQ